MNKLMRHYLMIALLLAASTLAMACRAAEPVLLTQLIANQTMEQVTTSLKQAIAAHNYAFVRQQAVDDRLVPANWEASSVRIVYFCNFAKMDAALKMDPRTAQAMPCRITLIEHQGGVELIAINPAWTSESWHAPEVHQFCVDLKNDYLAILSEVAL